MSEKTNISAIRHRFARVSDQISVISADLDISEREAFTRYVYSVLFNKNYDEEEFEDDLTDGPDDKQIDIVKIEREDGQCFIHLVQVKSTDSFSGTAVVRMRDALNWIFIRPKKEYKSIANKALVAKIAQIREARLNIGSKSIYVYLYYIANGDTSKISADFETDVDTTRKENEQEFADFKFESWGVDELVNREDMLNQQKRRIDVELPIIYDVNRPSLMTYDTSNAKSVVCTIQGSDLAKLVAEHKDWIFDENVRMDLGLKRSVNHDIAETAKDPQSSMNFWFFNNGITITCDSL